MPGFSALSGKELKAIILSCGANHAGLSEKTELVQLVASLAADRRFTFEQYSACHSVLASKGRTNPLEVLGVSSKEQAKSSFRRMSLLLHPDKCGYPLAEEAFKVISGAYSRVSSGEHERSQQFGGGGFYEDDDDDDDDEFGGGPFGPGRMPFHFHFGGGHGGFDEDFMDEFIFRAFMHQAFHGDGGFGGGSRFHHDPYGHYEDEYDVYEEDDNVYDEDEEEDGDEEEEEEEKLFGYDKAGGVYYCDVCSVETPSEKTYQAHINGKRHATNMEEGGFSAMFTCHECCASFATAAELEKHLADGAQDAHPAAAPPRAPPRAAHFFCDNCDVAVANEASWKAHIAGKRHAFNLKQSGSRVFYCDLCDVEAHNETTFNQHLTGQRHAKEMRRAGLA